MTASYFGCSPLANNVQHKGDDAMAKSMSPSKMTDPQVDKAVDTFRAALRKHLPEFPSGVVQQVLETKELGHELLQVFRKHVEALSGMITRRAMVNRTRDPQQVLDDTGRKQYTNKSVVKTMPRGEGEEVDIHFFKLGRYVSDDNLDKEYALGGLIPCDPYSLAKVNEDDPAFADERPNATHWKDEDGRWCFASFSRWDGERDVNVHRHDRVWGDGWWFAGVRK